MLAVFFPKKNVRLGLTKGMENDACFQYVDTEHIGIDGSFHEATVLLACCFGLDVSLAKIVNNERKEDARHNDGCRGTLESKATHAVTIKHEIGVCEKMYESSGKDDSSAELL